MKHRLWPLILSLVLVAGLAGCHNLGYNSQSLNNSLTPNVSQTEYTRTWQQSPGQPGQYSQNVTAGAPPAATTTDPANPNYNSGAPSPPPASSPAH
ncbi:MAG: hypothetical protein ABSH19_07880 [Opitutales bacterium]|jgi:hypothetical protein